MEGLKTGTTTLGIICKDGIVMAADKRATAGNFIAAKDVEKVLQLTENVALTFAGSVSDVQIFMKLLRSELNLRNIKSNRMSTIKEAANLSARMVYEGARQYFSSMTHILLGGYDKMGTHLYEIYADGSIMEVKDFISSGSGSPMVFGILENSYKDTLTVKEAEELAVRAISASIQRDSASGNGIDVLIVSKDGIRKSIQRKVPTMPI